MSISFKPDFPGSWGAAGILLDGTVWFSSVLSAYTFALVGLYTCIFDGLFSFRGLVIFFGDGCPGVRLLAGVFVTAVVGSGRPRSLAMIDSWFSVRGNDF